MNTLIISNEEMEVIMKVAKFLAESCLLIKGVNETIENEAKKQKAEFPSMLMATLDLSLLGNILVDKRVIQAREGTIIIGQNINAASSFN